MIIFVSPSSMLVPTSGPSMGLIHRGNSPSAYQDSMETEDNSVMECTQPKISYKSKLMGVIIGAFERAIYVEQLLFDDLEDEVNEFSEMNCIK